MTNINESINDLYQRHSYSISLLNSDEKKLFNLCVCLTKRLVTGKTGDNLYIINNLIPELIVEFNRIYEKFKRYSNVEIADNIAHQLGTILFNIANYYKNIYEEVGKNVIEALMKMALATIKVILNNIKKIFESFATGGCALFFQDLISIFSKDKSWFENLAHTIEKFINFKEAKRNYLESVNKILDLIWKKPELLKRSEYYEMIVYNTRKDLIKDKKRSLNKKKSDENIKNIMFLLISIIIGSATLLLGYEYYFLETLLLGATIIFIAVFYLLCRELLYKIKLKKYKNKLQQIQKLAGTECKYI